MLNVPKVNLAEYGEVKSRPKVCPLILKSILTTRSSGSVAAAVIDTTWPGLTIAPTSGDVTDTPGGRFAATDTRETSSKAPAAATSLAPAATARPAYSSDDSGTVSVAIVRHVVPSVENDEVTLTPT